MSYAFVLGLCYGCNRAFTYNPVRVPSIRDTEGTRQAICKDCADIVNLNRLIEGLEPIRIFDDAYTYCSEEEISIPKLRDAYGE